MIPAATGRWALACAALLSTAHAGPPPLSPTAFPQVWLSASTGAQPETRADEPLRFLDPRPCVVMLRDGRKIEGDLVAQDARSVTVRLHNIETRVPMTDIAEVLFPESPREQYDRLRAQVDRDDAESLLLLAEWCLANGLIDEALVELGRVRALAPGLARTEELTRLASNQRRLRDARMPADPRNAEPTREPTSSSEPTTGTLPTRSDPRAFPLISEDDVALLRVYEVDLDRAPRLVIDRATIDALLETHRGHPALPTTRAGRDQLYRAPAAQVLGLMFRVQARSLYPRVQVLDDPPALAIFREKVHRGWIMNSCATSRCHGGDEAGRLRLATWRPNHDRTVYTNFLILERTTLADGTPLIDHDQPARSPLLQMALPPEDSLHPHPEIHRGRSDRFRPVFRRVEDARFQEAVDWIRGLYRPRPEYPIDYTPPGMAEDRPRDANPER